MNKGWQQLEGEEASNAVFAMLDHIKGKQGNREAEYSLWAQKYLGISKDNFNWCSLDRVAANVVTGGPVPVGYNLIRSAINTVYNRIGKQKPIPTFVTEGGDWKLTRQVKKLNDVVITQLDANDFYSQQQRGFLDCLMFGDGFVKGYRHYENMKWERTFPLKLHVDKQEAINGITNTLYQEDAVTKEKLMIDFKKHESAILNASPVKASDYPYMYDTTSECVRTVEAWHLPIWHVENNEVVIDRMGKHIIAIEGTTLLLEDWSFPYFPFLQYTYDFRPLGFWNMGLAENLYPIHEELQETCRNIQTNLYFGSAPFWSVDSASKLIKTHLSNETGRIVEWSGTPPKLEVFQTTNPEVFRWKQELKEDGYRQEGISELASTATKPAGLDSGKAIREFNDIESERLITVGQMIEKNVVNAGKMTADLFIQGFKDKPENFTVRAQVGDYIRQIKWKTLSSLQSNKYVVKCLPKSFLSNTFSGRIQDAKDLIDLGVADNNSAAELIDFPDVKRYRSLRFASRDLIRTMVEDIVDENKFRAPEAWMDLNFAVQYGTQVLSEIFLQGGNGEEVKNLESFVSQASAMLTKASQPPAELPPPPAPQGNMPPVVPPMGAPMTE